jgi:GDP/GTP exchange factor required for growth at low temperature
VTRASARSSDSSFRLQKAQKLNSFSTLVAVMTGLQSEWVQRAMRRHYQQLPPQDHRIFRVLQDWVTGDDDFKHMRAQVNALGENQPTQASTIVPPPPDVSATASRRATTEVSTAPPGAIPFIGRHFLPSLSRAIR